MGAIGPHYYRVPLEALGLELPARRLADGRLFFPLATACAAIELDLRRQRERVRRDYPDHIERLRLATAGGPQELLCIEYEALGLWLATVQGKSKNERQQERLRLFRRLVMAAASDILMGRLKPVPMNERQQDLTELRLAELERAVFVGEPSDEADMVSGHCPQCGCPLRIDAASLVFVKSEG